MQNYSISSLVDKAEKQNKRISEIVLTEQAEDLDKTTEELWEQMASYLDIMIESVEKGTHPDIKSTSGLTGGDAFKIKEHALSGKTLGGSLFATAISRAMAVAEVNASMGRIVASPTAGSCGILPAALVTMMEDKNTPREDVIYAMFTAAAVGRVIATNASISGAEGGCQAECGASSAMAAAALVELSGGTPDMVSQAVAIAIKNVLGLVCDPVAGLVEIPCIKRNAGGITNALCAAEIALSGVASYIPADETILSMKEIGDTLPATLRETAEGGLAISPTGQKLYAQVFGEKKY